MRTLSFWLGQLLLLLLLSLLLSSLLLLLPQFFSQFQLSHYELAASNFAASSGIFAAYTQHLGLVLLNKKPTGLGLCHLLLIWLFYNYNYRTTIKKFHWSAFGVLVGCHLKSTHPESLGHQLSQVNFFIFDSFSFLQQSLP